MATIVAANHVEPSSSSLHTKSESITRIDSKLYNAAVEGNFNEFINVDNIESLLTPKKNNVLHVHLTSTVTHKADEGVLQSFVQQILGKFRCLKHEKIERAVSEDFVKQILDECGGLALRPNSKGETPLHLAARYGQSGITKLLIERAKDADEMETGFGAYKELMMRAKTENDDTALHEAGRYDHAEVVEMLLEMDRDLSNFANKANETPLYLASERKYKRIVQMIADKVESPAYQGPSDRTALHAAVINSDIGMVKDLLRNKHLRATVKHADSKGWVPLHYAVKGKNKSLTKLLLEQDEDTAYMQDNEGTTALHIAAYCGHEDMMKMILRYYPDCSELVDSKGWNALHYAVNGSFPLVVATIMQNLSLSNLYNEKDKDGNTPLHHLVDQPTNATFQGKSLLLHYRVDKLALNKNDQAPLDVANAITKDGDIALAKQLWIRWLKEAGARGSQRLYAKSKGGWQGRPLMFTKEAKESHLIVATLIATVTFAAAFTLPGGTEQDGEHKGRPIMGHRASFKAFIISNTISLVMATSAAFIHLFSPLNKPNWLDYYFSQTAFSFIVVAVTTMIVAFGTGTYAIFGPSAIGIAVITIGLSFFLIFMRVLEKGFGIKSLKLFILNLVNVTSFSFTSFERFGTIYTLFQRSDKDEKRII